MSDPDKNANFRRKWEEPPPDRRKRRPVSDVTGPAQNSLGSSNAAEHSDLNRRSQRAYVFDAAADRELSLGHLSIAERLASMAAALREAAQ